VYRERGTHSPKQKFARQKIYTPKKEKKKMKKTMPKI
jgi:hypothetical protein